MGALITAAARALAVRDPLGALNRVALRDDAPALALRSIAMASLGDLVRARVLLRSAARTLGPKEGSRPLDLVELGGKVYFFASAGGPGPAASASTTFTKAGELLFFAAGDGVHGRKLWAKDLP